MVHFRLFTAGLSQLISTKSIWSAQFNEQEIVKASVTRFTVAQEINLWRALEKNQLSQTRPFARSAWASGKPGETSKV